MSGTMSEDEIRLNVETICDEMEKEGYDFFNQDISTIKKEVREKFSAKFPSGVSRPKLINIIATHLLEKLKDDSDEHKDNIQEKQGDKDKPKDNIQEECSKPSSPMTDKEIEQEVELIYNEMENDEYDFKNTDMPTIRKEVRERFTAKFPSGVPAAILTNAINNYLIEKKRREQFELNWESDKAKLKSIIHKECKISICRRKLAERIETELCNEFRDKYSDQRISEVINEFVKEIIPDSEEKRAREEKLREENETLQKELVKYKKIEETHECLKVLMKRELADHKEEINKLATTNENLKAENKTLRQENETLTRENVNFDDVNNSLEQVIKSLREENKTLEDKIYTLKQENESLERVAEDRKHSLDDFVQENDGLKGMIDRLKEENRTLKRENERLADEKESYKQEYNPLERENENLKFELRLLRIECGILNEQVMISIAASISLRRGL